jgi:hypothetical protein
MHKILVQSPILKKTNYIYMEREKERERVSFNCQHSKVGRLNVRDFWLLLFYFLLA